MLYRAYSLLHVKAVDAERRVFSGIATTPEVDRVGDIVESSGVTFKNPLSLMLYHKHDLPVGKVVFGKATADGIPFEASIPDVVETGRLKDRVDEAWQSVKYQIIRGVSIGFRALDDGIETLKSGGLRFTKTEVLELSLVAVPANASATITTIKSIDAPYLAASGRIDPERMHVHTPGVSGTPVVRLLPTRLEKTMQSLSDQITSYKSTRDQKFEARNALMTKASDGGVTLDESESQQYDTLDAEIKALDTHIARLESMQSSQKAMAVPVNGTSSVEGHASRGGTQTPVIRVQPNEEKGIGFAKAAICKVASYLSMGTSTPLDIAKARYPDNDRLHAFIKAAVPAATTTHVTWAAPLVNDPTNLTSDFIEFQRPGSLLGKLGPRLRQSPFRIRIPKQVSGGDAYWVGEGAAKPVTKFDFGSVSLDHHKVATIAVITEELARFSAPNAEVIVRNALAGAVNERIDIDLLDPTVAAVAGVSPASLTNGLTPLSPSGTTADAARSDVARLVARYIAANNSASSLVLAMPDALALFLSVMRNALGQREFPNLTMNGGDMDGIPVVTSQYLANSSGAGNLVVAINGSDVLLADDGNVTVDVSREASIQMLDNPTNSSATGTPTTMVSLWQTNSIGLRAEREITWGKAKAEAVVYIDDVNWGSVGSPA